MAKKKIGSSMWFSLLLSLSFGILWRKVFFSFKHFVVRKSFSGSSLFCPHFGPDMISPSSSLVRTLSDRIGMGPKKGNEFLTGYFNFYVMSGARICSEFNFRKCDVNSRRSFKSIKVNSRVICAHSIRTQFTFGSSLISIEYRVGDNDVWWMYVCLGTLHKMGAY